MDILGEKNTNWNVGEVWPATNEPSADAAGAPAQSESSLTAAAVVGLALVVLVAIAAVFVLGVLIDCRQQKIMDKKLGVWKRQNGRRACETVNETATIADNMQPMAESSPPACVVHVEP